MGRNAVLPQACFSALYAKIVGGENSDLLSSGKLFVAHERPSHGNT